jgi:hypothetical protein
MSGGGLLRSLEWGKKGSAFHPAGRREGPRLPIAVLIGRHIFVVWDAPTSATHRGLVEVVDYRSCCQLVREAGYPFH